MFCTSCGKELKEGVAFCTRCGKPVKGNNTNAYSLKKEVDNETNNEINHESDVDYNSQQSSEEQIQHNMESSSNSNSQTVGNSYNNNRYQSMNSGYNNNGNNSGNNYGYNPGVNNSYQNNGQYNNGYQNNQNNGQYNRYNITPQQIYKRSVLPFKIVSAILNLFSLFILWMIGLVAVAVGSESYKEYRHSWITGFEVYGYITVILGLVLLVFIVLGFALPAKAGVATNLITTITCTVFLIWGMVKYAVLLSKVNHYIHSIGYVTTYSDDAQSLAIGAIIFCVFAMFFQIISLVFSCLGLAKKKNYGMR